MAAIQLLLVLLLCGGLANSQLPAFGSCHIGADVNNSVGTPYYSRPGNGGLRTVYSCVANDNCNYDVHVIGCYESEYITNRYRSSSYVYIHVQGQSSKPLILVLLTYRPMWWSLRISSDVVIDTVILGGYQVARSQVSFTPGRVLSVEKPSPSVLPQAHGSTDYSDSRDTIKVLQYIANRFGPVASFTGTYRATSWTLNINRRSADLGCVSVTPPPTISTPLFTTTVAPANCTAPLSPQGSCSGGRQCVRNIFGYPICSNGPTGSRCSNGYCRCPNSRIREPCNCYPRLGGCLVQEGSSNAVGTPYSQIYSNRSPTTYSCVTDCTGTQYEVHVIGIYYNSVFRDQNVAVEMTVCGHSSKPLVLVLISYRAQHWTVNVPNGVTIESILVSSYYPDSTNVSHTPGRVGTVEKVGYGYLPSGYGRDGSRGFTAESLQYLINRFGAIASFSGTYSADKWVLDIQRDQRENGSSNSCVTSVTATTEPPTASSTCFRCGSQCIPRYQVCDRIRQCSDGGDERGCGYTTPSTSSRPSVSGSKTPSTSSRPSVSGSTTPSTSSRPSVSGSTTPSTSSRPSVSGSTLGVILGTTCPVIAIGCFFCVCVLAIGLVKNSGCPQGHSSNVSPQPPTTYSYSLHQPPTVNSSSEATTGVPHSTIPFESELQNVPPPDYSTAHQYPMYTQPDKVTSLSYIKEPPPPYPN